MSIRNKMTNRVTNTVGNKVLNIEEIKEKSNLPVTQNELQQRRCTSRESR